MILGKLFNRSQATTVSRQIYGAVMAQARAPELFRDLAIPDTVTGRFDMLGLHLLLVSHRLASETEPGAAALNQQLFDVFTADLDAALREIGIGDSTVSKRKKRLVHTYFGHLAALAPALDQADGAKISKQVQERFYFNLTPQASARLADILGGYVLNASKGLRNLNWNEISAGHIVWPPHLVK